MSLIFFNLHLNPCLLNEAYLCGMKKFLRNVGNCFFACVIFVSLVVCVNAKSVDKAPGKLILYADGNVRLTDSAHSRLGGDVIYTRSPRRVYPHMDFSRLQTNAYLVLPGYLHSPDIIPFTGKGVVIGVVDGGIDPHHPTFLNSSRTATRVSKYVFTRSASESESGYMEADVYSTPEAVASAPADDSSEGHGTHTASIAAGAWNGNEYSGMAPDAELVLVTMGEYLYDDEIIYGMNSVADYAASVNKPCVMNFSLGNPLGPRDGTGLFSLAAAKATERGAVIMASSGNDGGKRITIMHDFSMQADTLATICWNYYGSDPEPVFVEVWGEDARGIEIALVVVNDYDDGYCYSTPFYSVADMDKDGGLVLLSSDKEEYSAAPDLKNYYPEGDIDIEMGVYPPSKRFRIALNALLPGYKNGIGKRGRLGFMLRSREGANVRVLADGFTFFGSGGKKGFSDAVRTQTISDLSIGKGIISVGSTNTQKEEIVNLDGDTIRMSDYQQYGEPDDYTHTSSYGTSFTPEQEIYPHVLAPGTFIVAAYNANVEATSRFRVAKDVFNGKTEYWGQYTGTSMSSPAVAGIVALWMEANPYLTYTDVEEILSKTSNRRNFREKHGDVVRYGLIDAYAGLKMALSSGVETAEADPDYSPRLMMRNMGNGLWECVIAGAMADGSASLISLDGKIINLGDYYDSSFILNLAAFKGMYILSIPTPKGIVTAKLVL